MNTPFSRPCVLSICILICVLTVAGCVAAEQRDLHGVRPNILLIVADDISWREMSVFGNRVVETPNFDRLAESGIMFENAFSVSPSCSPSRAAILTGQHIWRLGPAASLDGALDLHHPVYPELLEQSGYFVGFTGKGFSRIALRKSGRDRSPAGHSYHRRRTPVQETLNTFLLNRPEGSPFCFWIGTEDAHSPWSSVFSRQEGLDADTVALPPHLPDTPEVRQWFIDYLAEVQRFDRTLGELFQIVRDHGLFENTIIIVISDNGIDIPRGKAELYDAGTHMPMALSWPALTGEKGRVLTDFISFADIAPTLLDLAGVQTPHSMSGRSFIDLLASTDSGRIDETRDHVFTARERHSPYRANTLPYPARAIRTERFLYIRNFAPERWPAGDPPYYADARVDSLFRLAIVDAKRSGQGRYYDLCFGKRPSEELYVLADDPWQINNVADDPAYAETRERLARELESFLKKTGDPRTNGDDGGWDSAGWDGGWQLPEFGPDQ